MEKRSIKGALPYIPDTHIEPIIEKIRGVLTSGKLTQGESCRAFERRFAAYVGCKYAITANSGGVALEIVLRALGIRGKEVIVPTDTFMATPNSVVLAGGKPVFADIRAETLSIDPNEVRKRITKNTKALMLVHMFGLMSDDIHAIKEICDERGVYIIEDASHAHGAVYRDMKAGSIGHAGCFSMYATKVITTGEGGVIVTDDEKLMDLSSSIRNYGKDHSTDDFIRLGSNWRMAEIPAILGSYQIDVLDDFISHRNRVAMAYIEYLSKWDYIELYRPHEGMTHSYWRFPVILPDGMNRAELQRRLADEYDIRITWMYDPPCHLQLFYREYLGTKEGDFPVAEGVLKRLVCLPVHMGVSVEGARYVAESFMSVVHSMREGCSK